jgi:hypothetical protein
MAIGCEASCRLGDGASSGRFLLADDSAQDPVFLLLVTRACRTNKKRLLISSSVEVASCSCTHSDDCNLVDHSERVLLCNLVVKVEQC